MKFAKPILFFMVSFSILSPFLCASSRADPLDHWTQRYSGTSVRLNGIFFERDRFLVVGRNGTILSSLDGRAWTARNSGTTVFLTSVTYGEGYFVAVGEESTILNSINGFDWNKITSGFAHTLEALTYGGQFVAMADNNQAVYSVDGVRWVFRTIVNSGVCRDATYGPGTYVAVGNNGVIIITNSSACCNWTSSSSGTTEHLGGVAFGGATGPKFVAVGHNGTIVTSPDGVIWTKRDSGTTAHLRGVAYGGNTFVAVGAFGTILTSPEGINWTTRSAGIDVWLNNVAYGNRTFVAIGEQGKIFQTDVIPSGGDSGGSGLPKPPSSLTIE